MSLNSFKKILKEYLYGLGLRKSEPIKNSSLFCGFPAEDINVRLTGLTLISRLISKYYNKPELFFNEGKYTTNF